MSNQQNRPNTPASGQTPRTNTPITPGGDRAQPGTTPKAPHSDSDTKSNPRVPKHGDNEDPRKLDVEAGQSPREGGSKRPS